jgi:hypothetical protein
MEFGIGQKNRSTVLMSLDVYLTVSGDSVESPSSEKIFVRENGQTIEISREEWDERFPGREPATVWVEPKCGEVFSANVTHNLNEMAAGAGIYEHLWRPDEIGISKAAQLIEPLKDGLALLQSEPDRFKAFNPPNGWGSYDGFVHWVARYLEACCQFPDAEVSVSR